MSDNSLEAANNRFEQLWSSAQSHITGASTAKIQSDLSSNPLSYLDELLPQHYAARFADLADQCFAEKLLTEEQYSQLKQASAIQQAVYSALDQDKL